MSAINDILGVGLNQLFGYAKTTATVKPVQITRDSHDNITDYYAGVATFPLTFPITFAALSSTEDVIFMPAEDFYTEEDVGQFEAGTYIAVFKPDVSNIIAGECHIIIRDITYNVTRVETAESAGLGVYYWATLEKQ